MKIKYATKPVQQIYIYILNNTGFDGRVRIVLRVQVVAQAPEPKERNN